MRRVLSVTSLVAFFTTVKHIPGLQWASFEETTREGLRTGGGPRESKYFASGDVQNHGAHLINRFLSQLPVEEYLAVLHETVA